MTIKKTLILFWFSFVSILLSGQTTTIVGEVYDAETGQALADVNLSIQGTPYGSASDDEGFFYIKADINKKSTLVASAVGYKTERFHITPGESLAIEIALTEKTTNLTDVFVLPGSNPALPLMERVRAHRNENNIAYFGKEEADTQTDVLVSDIQARQLKKRIWQSLESGMVSEDDSTYLLPIYHSSKKNGQTQIQSAICDATGFTSLLSGVDGAPNFYLNSIPLYDQSFVSPLASNSNSFYNYYLIDSIPAPIEDDGILKEDSSMAHHERKTYTVDFRSRNPYYPTFNGRMQIDSLTCAIISIHAVVPPQVSANYLRNVTIDQQFTLEDQFPTLTAAHTSMLLDAAIKADTSRTFPTLLINSYVEGRKNEPDSQTKDEYTHHISDGDSTVAAVSELPLIRTAKFLAYIIQTGYIPTGSYIEVGKVNEIIRFTPQEGMRLGIPLRTSEKLWKNVCLEAYAAYGFKDHGWKGSGMIHINLPTQRRHVLHLRYTDDYTYSEINYFNDYYRENAMWFKSMGLTTALTRGIYNLHELSFNHQVRQREFRFWAENDWNDILEQDFYISVERRGYQDPTTEYTLSKSFTHSAVGTTFRLGFDDRRVDMYFRRFHTYGRLPILYLGAEIGSYRTEKISTYGMYGKLNLMLRQTLPLGIMGKLTYIFDAGMIIGNVPYPLLNIFSGNQSYAYDPYRFTLMYDYEFAADRYMLLHTEWNGRGCLFNLIPGIRALRLRELVTFKIAWGGLHGSHFDLLDTPEKNITTIDPSYIGTPTFQPLTTPYIELGCGIGNIFRVCDLHAIWRLTHRDEPGTANWGIRFRLIIEQ
ncbi:MAG: DUF5686 and carboxypeptidase regulatory-like domain-containing protein [Paludibacteraceae bacterium]|nr:DUF5686 and carboxypeptidase regulatory-like domain-containing protein [Paludibacteraceae bacterium]